MRNDQTGKSRPVIGREALHPILIYARQARDKTRRKKVGIWQFARMPMPRRFHVAFRSGSGEPLSNRGLPPLTTRRYLLRYPMFSVIRLAYIRIMIAARLMF